VSRSFPARSPTRLRRTKSETLAEWILAILTNFKLWSMALAILGAIVATLLIG
jgi:hypothetical protein